jgi:thioredoxin-related protein
MKKNALLALVSTVFIFSFTKVKPTEKEKINWLTMDEVNVKMKSDPKPVIIDLYTDWCYWCKVMDKKTYTNSKVTSYINQHFYAVKLNAETKDDVKWDNKNYEYNSGDKINDFALYVTQGQLAFPNTVIFPEMQNPPAAIPGFMEPKEIEVILKYFGEGIYKKQNFNVYSANFKATW